MKWIVVAILVMLVPYTWLTIKYRKSGPAFQPYSDTKKQAIVQRLLKAGYHRISIEADRPADLPRSHPDASRITRVAGGLPASLADLLIDPPLLPENYPTVDAAPQASTQTPYTIVLSCRLPGPKTQLGGAELYLRQNLLVAVPTLEPIDGQLLARLQETPVRLTVSGGTLPAGDYTVLLVGAAESRQWSLQVH